jgi:hypothetical protein
VDPAVSVVFSREVEVAGNWSCTIDGVSTGGWTELAAATGAWDGDSGRLGGDTGEGLALLLARVIALTAFFTRLRSAFAAELGVEARRALGVAGL